MNATMKLPFTKKTLGGRTYRVTSVDVQYIDHKIVCKVYTLVGGKKVTVSGTKVTHPDGTVTQG